MKKEYQSPKVLVVQLDMNESVLNNLSVRDLDGGWVDED